MSDESTTINSGSEEIIDVPSFLSGDDYGVALAVETEDCGNCQNGSESCGTTQAGVCSACEGYGGEACHPTWEDCGACQTSCQDCEGLCQSCQGCTAEMTVDCGVCQNGGQTCGTSQYGDCSSCQGWSCQATCEIICMDACQDACQNCQTCQSCQNACQYACQAACEKASQRPDDFAWTTDISKGTPILHTAEEWNAFTSKINEFRTYKGLASITFNNPVKGDYIMASNVAEAWDALNDMEPPSALPEKVTAGSSITAISLNGLVASLNSIV